MAAQYPTSAAGDSDLYVAVNQKSTPLTDNPLTVGATTVNVVDASSFPSVGAITIDAEIIKYTGKTGTSFTGCTRGFDGTSDVQHSVNTPVYHRIIADHHNVLKEEIKAIEGDLVAVKAALNDVATPASTATDIKNRTDQIVSEIKRITGNTNWYDAVAKNLTQLLPLSGGTMSGNIAMGSNKLTGLAAGSVNGDSVRYEQAVFNSGDQSISGIKTFTGQLVGVGTATNNNAPAGYIGETVSSAVSATNLPASTNFGDLTSISLTAGDWMIYINTVGFVAATTTTYFQTGVSTTSGNIATGLVDGDTRVYAGQSTAFAATALPSMAVVGKRFSLASTTTVYLKYQAIYSAGTPQMAGRITAVRIR